MTLFINCAQRYCVYVLLNPYFILYCFAGVRVPSGSVRVPSGSVRVHAFIVSPSPEQNISNKLQCQNGTLCATSSYLVVRTFVETHINLYTTKMVSEVGCSTPE